MPYSITTRDGITLQNIPDDVPADSPELKQRVATIRQQTQAGEAPTDRQQLLSNPLMRLAKGLKDPIDGAAQLLQRAMPQGVADAVNKAADTIGGEGSFAGDVLGIKGATSQQLTNDIRDSNAEYDAARRATAPPTLSTLITGQRDPGFDAMRMTGNLVSPVNLTIGRLIPVAGVGAPLAAAARAGAFGGAAGGAVQPVEGDNFWGAKAAQIGLGSAGGAVLNPVLSKLGESAAKLITRWRANGAVNVTPERLRDLVAHQLQQDGVDVQSLPEATFSRLQDDVRSALVKGRELNPVAALRKQDFDALGIPATQGQLSRDPAQWQREFNLAGVEGVGEPLQAVQQAQQRGIAGVFDRGAGGAQETFDAGSMLKGKLQAADATARGNVRAAYQAYEAANGKALDIPLQGVAQDYAQTLDTFGEAIPGAVRKKFEGLGLLDGQQRKVFSIDDAEKLIKVINANYDPAGPAPAKAALDGLRSSIERAVTQAADTSAPGAEAAHLASEARQTAAQRFQAIKDTPALKAAVRDMQPDDFVRRFVIGGKVNEIQGMQQLLDQEGRDQVRAQTVAYLQQKAFGPNIAGDGKAAQASFNRELQRIGRPKLDALLGKDGAEEMYRIGRVLAYIKQVPEGATPNTSGTGQMLTSMMGRMRGIQGLPYLNDFVVKPLGSFMDRRAVSQALSGEVPGSPAQLDPQAVQALSALFAPAPVATGTALGYSVR